jgi:hypothetical protein
MQCNGGDICVPRRPGLGWGGQATGGQPFLQCMLCGGGKDTWFWLVECTPSIQTSQDYHPVLSDIPLFLGTWMPFLLQTGDQNGSFRNTILMRLAKTSTTGLPSMVLLPHRELCRWLSRVSLSEQAFLEV